MSHENHTIILNVFFQTFRVMLAFSQFYSFQIIEADINVLQEMFPDVRTGAIRDLRQRLSTNAFIDVLVSEQEKKSKPATLSHLLHTLSKSTIDEEETYTLRVNRSCIFNAAQVFYKRTMRNKTPLLKTLVIEFSGKEGVDAGALRNEFFERAIEEGNRECFEGDLERHLPKNYWDGECNLELFGTLTGHSLLQGGLGLPCIHPGLVRAMETSSSPVTCEYLEPDELPGKEDIPLNAATEHLIEKVCTIKL